MSSFEKIYFSIFGLIMVLLIIYWGRLAWFHPDKLKQRFMERAKKHPDWLFVKGYSLKFSDKYGTLMMRFITLMLALFMLIFTVRIALDLLGIIK